MTQTELQQALEIGRRHHRAGRLHDAEMAYRRVLGVDPNQPDALNLLGILAAQVGKTGPAVELIGRAIALKPQSPEFHSNLGQALVSAGRFDDGIIAFHRALILQPRYVEALYNLANALAAKGKLDHSIAAYRKCIELRPDFILAYNNLGISLCKFGQRAHGIEALRYAISLAPDFPESHYNLGMYLLLEGNFENGWAEHEWRRKVTHIAPFCQNFDKPMWDGSDLQGRKILLHAEQGFGDTIQFARFVPLVAARGGNVILQVQPELVRLLIPSVAGVQVVALGQPLLDFDIHCPLMSLPAVLKTTLDSIPATIPYLRADEQLVSQWRNRLPIDRVKIGIAWLGRATHRNDRNRSIPSDVLSPLIQLSDISFINLQKGGEAISGVSDFTADLNDFADTAALIENLDLIISVDTAVAHLAGAMGKQVWVLLPYVPDWRWLLDREDSPWYPTMRIFRQPQMGDWETPIQKIIEAIHQTKRPAPAADPLNS